MTPSKKVLDAAQQMLRRFRGRNQVCGTSNVVDGWWIEVHTLGCRNAADDPKEEWEERHWEIFNEYSDDGMSVVIGEPPDPFVTMTPQRKQESLLRKFIRESLRRSNIKAMSRPGRTYAMMSAYGKASKSVNKVRHQSLLEYLRKNGHKRFWETKAPPWDVSVEKGVLVADMIFEEAVHLGKKYKQGTIGFKGSDGMVAFYNLKSKTATVSLESVPKMSSGRNLYSKTQGISFEFDISKSFEVPWDGRTQLHWEDVEDKAVAA